jgi:hypothetical protein
MIAGAESTARRFDFGRDTFAFRHELVWEYQFDAATGAMTTRRNDPPPSYYHRCFVLVRAVRLFFDYARFAPELPPADAATYGKLVRAVISRNPRRTAAAGETVEIPGYASLREFSAAQEGALKAHCGAAWESYFLRSHWRMIFRVSGRFQEKMAEKLKRSIARRGLALVHLFRFPRITINHGIALYRFTETEGTVEFTAYDPNLPSQPVTLVYEKKRRAFTFAPNLYWGGGVVSVMEIYCGFPY